MNGHNKNQTLTVLSWNVNGFTLKKSHILHYLNLLQVDVVFLQETHTGPGPECPAGTTQIQGFEPDFDWAVFTIFKKTCRGVAVLFRKGLGCEGLRVVGDDKGRYLIISCRIHQKDFEFVNVYNTTDERIDFNQFRETLIPVSETTYFVIAGDFNTVMDAEVDRTSNIRNRGHKVRFTDLRTFLETFSLVDIWRWLYPEQKSYTYFDVKGKSRLDYFFLPKRYLTSVNACKIHDRPQYLDREGYISDHAPISIEIQTGGHRRQFFSEFLRDEDAMQQLSHMITSFSSLKSSRKGDLWPALKSRLMCEMLDFKNCGNNFKIPRCLAEIQMYHDLPEKQLVERKGLLGSTNPGQISHSSHYLSEVSNLEEYLDYLYETKMFEDIELTLNAILTEPVSKREILSTIFSLRNSDHLTPDGLSISFYKHFASKLTDLLQGFFNQVLDLQDIKCVFNESFTSEPFTTTSLDFDYTDHTYCVQHHTPFTVFNVDYNILASILADRLNGIVGYMLKQRKTGSLLSVQDYINAFESIKANQLPVLVISVRVDPSALKWPYLFHRLKSLKLPYRFRSVVRSLVQTLQPLARGLKLGCPLTPSLISVCLLPLIHSVNVEERLDGVSIGAEIIKATLENDRAMLFVSNPNEALHVFEEVLRNFMDNSGFVIDRSSSEVFITGQPGFSLEKERLHLFKRSGRVWYKGFLVCSDGPTLSE